MSARITGVVVIAGIAYYSPALAKEPAQVEHYSITTRYSTVSEGGGSSGSSRGSNAYREEVRTDAEGCRLRQFDIDDTDGRKRPLSQWQMPIVVRQCPGAAPALANRDAMLARRDAFLAAMNVTTDVCGAHYFTWNVFRIDCDPDEAVDRLAEIDLGSIRLEDGAEYALPDTGTRVTLRRKASEVPGQILFAGSAAIDPEYLRSRAAETIMVVAEVSGEKMTRDEAISQIAGRRYSGESAITLVAEPETGRITVTLSGEVKEIGEDGTIETRKGETVTTRQRVEAAPGSDPFVTSSD